MKELGNVIGERLRNLRIEKTYTQAYVARLLRVDRSTYVHWEQGVVPTVTFLIDIANIYGVSLDELCGFIPNASKRVTEYDASINKISRFGIKSHSSGNDVILGIYGTNYNIAKSELPGVVRRTEALYKRMIKDVVKDMFAAAAVLTINDKGKNTVLTRDYLEGLLDVIEEYTLKNDRELTPELLAGFVKDRLMIMSKKNRKAAWEQLIAYIAEQDKFLAGIHDIDVEDISKVGKWAYPAHLFK